MAKVPTETPGAYQVLESFVIEVDGAPVVYAKGEPVHPDDPIVKKYPKQFGPLAFPHPPYSTRRRAEVRAELPPAEIEG
jgi:hypothetical protein